MLLVYIRSRYAIKIMLLMYNNSLVYCSSVSKYCTLLFGFFPADSTGCRSRTPVDRSCTADRRWSLRLAGSADHRRGRLESKFFVDVAWTLQTLAATSTCRTSAKLDIVGLGTTGDAPIGAAYGDSSLFETGGGKGKGLDTL